MEIQKIDKSSIKIKGKAGSFVVDPQNTIKTQVSANCIVLLSKEKDFQTEKVEDYTLIIQGPGEYEFAGIKLSVSQTGGHLLYKIIIDGQEIFLSNIEALGEIKELAEGSPIAIFNTNSLADSSLIAKLSPQVLILYGEKAMEQSTAMGKESVSVSKYQIKNEKLPEEMEVVVLN